MLKEAEKIVSSAFHTGFTKKICSYLHDCVREEVQSSTFRNLKQDKDNRWIVIGNENEEELFTNFDEPIYFDGSDNSVTELMIWSNKGAKDKHLIYGYLFLTGKNSKNRKNNEFLTPLLYMPCKLEREETRIKCTLTDEALSLNTGALSALMGKRDDEDDAEYILEGILESMPTLPLTPEKLDIFLTTLKSLIPDLDIKVKLKSPDALKINFGEESSHEDTVYDEQSEPDYFEETSDEDEDEEIVKPSGKVSLIEQSALVLTKRPVVTAGVLHELDTIANMPDGIISETVLGKINDEYSTGITEKDLFKKEVKDFYPITPLSLSDSQEQVLKNLEKTSLVSVYGPPGTGKSQTIVNLVSHLIANGKTVLVASKMDKATDVIAERLNNLGAPYLALRAGRTGYRKQLAHDLDLLSKNLVELDEGFEDTLIVQNDDMKELLSKINENCEKCDKLIKLEEEWFEKFNEYNEKAKDFPPREILKTNPEYSDIAVIKSLLENIKNRNEKNDPISKIKLFFELKNFKKLTGIKDFYPNTANIIKLFEELKEAELSTAAENIENEIFSLGNFRQLTDEIKNLQKKQKTLAINILRKKRREALKTLLRDEKKIRRLKDHVKSLTAREKLRGQILEGQDFKPLTEAFPCQCVTSYAVSSAMPLKPGLFDVVIIDEASQCDIASCIPLLFRAKKAVIVGDDKQLTHLSFLENAKEQSFAVKNDIPEKYRLVWSFRTNSMFDLANYYSINPVLLDEHFRCLAPIIEFSNREFYDGSLKIMTPSVGKNKILELIRIKDGKTSSLETKNLPEVEAVIEKLHEIILEDERNEDYNHTPVSIGVISPFRSQADAIKKAILKSFPGRVIERHLIDVGTAHTFQGDERDIILISWAIADNSFPQSLTFLQKPNLFNVAVTRAKNRTISFLSKNPDDLPPGLLRNYIEYIAEYEQLLKTENEEFFNNPFEREIAQNLKDKGYDVKPGVKIAGFNVDLFVTGKDGKSVIVECDGVPDKKGNKRISPIKKQLILNRAGFKVLRVSFRIFKNCPNVFFDGIERELEPLTAAV